LATRVDAFGEEATFELGAAHKVKLESRLRLLEEGNLRKLSGTGKAKAKFEKYQAKRWVIVVNYIRVYRFPVMIPKRFRIYPITMTINLGCLSEIAFTTMSLLVCSVY